MTEAKTSEFDHNNNNPKKTTRSTEDGLSGLPSFGDEDDKGGILEDGLSGLPSSGDGLCCYGEKDVKGGILEDWLSGLSCYGVEDVKGGVLDDGSSGLSCNSVEDDKGGILEDGSSGLSCYSVEDVKGVILEDGSSGLSCYGVEDVKVGILEGWLSGMPSYGDEDDKVGIMEDGSSGLSCYGDEDDKVGILEDGFAEKVKKKGRICETVGRLSDPLYVLGSDIMLLILSCPDARSVALCLLVSRGWRAVASSDKIWSSKCEELWQGKTHLPRIAKVNKLSKLAVYSLSVMDGKRKRIRREDLCDHVWKFHFTKSMARHYPPIEIMHGCSSHQIELVEFVRA